MTKKPVLSPEPIAATIEINPGFRRALDIMEGTSRHVFITGKAGTGKSTLLELWRGQTLKRIAVLAPTGVAALNVRGQTIHSFFGFKPDVTPEAVRKLGKGRGAAADRVALYRNLDAIVIDEVSMVRADLMDCVEKFLRLNGPRPKERFGGLQMIFIGDLYQLPPVVTGRAGPLRPGSAVAPPRLRPARRSAGRPTALSGRPLRIALFLLGPDLRRAGLRPGVRRAREGLPPDRRRVHRPPQRHPQPLGRRRADRPPQQPPRSGVRPARRRVLHHSDQHERPGRRPQPREARLAPRPRPAATKASSRASSTAPPSRPTSPSSSSRGAQVMLLTNDRKGRWVNGTIGRVVQDRQGPGRATTSSRSSSPTATRSTSRPTPGSSSTSSTTPRPTASSRSPSARSPSIRCAWPGP